MKSLQLFGYEFTCRPVATYDIIREVVENELDIRLFNSCKGLEEFKRFYKMFQLVRLIESGEMVKLTKDDPDFKLELSKFYDKVMSMQHLDKINDFAEFGIGREGKVRVNIEYDKLYCMRQVTYTKHC